MVRDIETRHVKLDYVGALSAKKDLLGAEINLLNIVKRMKGYRVARMKEMSAKNKLRIELGKLMKQMNGMNKYLPSEEIIDKRKNKTKKIVDDSRDLDAELKDIKKKLASLDVK